MKNNVFDPGKPQNLLKLADANGKVSIACSKDNLAWFLSNVENRDKKASKKNCRPNFRSFFHWL